VRFFTLVIDPASRRAASWPGQWGAADRVTIKVPRDKPESGSSVLMPISSSLKSTQAGGHL
jgi:hypothetical protein